MPNRIEGTIHPSTLTPFLKIYVIGPQQKTLECVAILDTGFAGEVILPEPQINALGLVQIGTDDVELANGEIVELDLFRGKIQWLGKVREVAVGATRSEDVLVGTLLFEQCVVHLDFLHGMVEVIQSE